MTGYIINTIFDKSYKMYKISLFGDSLSLLKRTSTLWFGSNYKAKFMFLMGLNYYKLKDYVQAERVLLEAYAVFPKNPKILMVLSKIYKKLERENESKAVFKKARSIMQSLAK